MRKLITIFALLLVLIPSAALAFDFRTSETGLVNTAASEEVRNTYLFGSTVNADATSTADQVVFGGNITVNGRTAIDLIAAGGNVIVNGEVGANARLAGGNVLVNSTIFQDLLIAAGVAKIGQDALIKEDLAVAAGTIELSGNVDGNAYLSNSGEITINGTINGNVIAQNIGSLKIGPNAIINGSLNYTAPQPAQITEGAQINGEVSFNEIQKQTSKTSQNLGAFVTTSALIWLIASFITLLVLVLLMPKFSLNLVQTAFSKPWLNLLWGFVTLIIAPIVIILLMITIIGIKLGLLAGAFYLILLFIAQIFAALLIGSLLYKWLGGGTYRANWATVLIGVIVGAILTLIPFVGWIINFIFFLFALGVLITMFFNWIGQQLEGQKEVKDEIEKPKMPIVKARSTRGRPKK